MKLTALNKVSKVSWASQLSYEILYLSFEWKFRKDKLQFSKKTHLKSPHRLGWTKTVFFIWKAEASSWFNYNFRLGEWLVFKSDGSARCENKKYCKRFDNWHWWSPHQRCYRQFSQGPCKKGNIFKKFTKKTFHKYLLSIQLGQSISELKKLLKSQFPILWEGGVKKKLFRDKIFYGFSQS